MSASAVPLHDRIRDVTARIRERSAPTRADYLAGVTAGAEHGVARERLACTNLAHGFAAAEAVNKDVLKRLRYPNIAIVSAYNDMLSAHQPFERFPAVTKGAAREAGAVAQFAGGVPASDPGAAGDGAVALQPRRDRHGHGGGPGPQHVRRRPLPRDLRQDRARLADRRPRARP